VLGHDAAGLAQTFTSAQQNSVEEMVGVFKHAVKTAVAVVIVAVVAVGCGGGSSSDESSTNAGKGEGGVADPTSPVEISFASWVGKEPGMKDLYKKFQAEHPNIKVKFVNIPSEGASQKLTTQIAGGNPPDAAYLDAGTTADFASRGALVKLDDYVKRTPEQKPDDYVDSFIGSAKYQDGLYALPFDGESTGLFYRTDLFKEAGISEPPKTWDEFETDAQKLTDPAKKRYGFALFASESAYYWYPWLWQAGGTLLSDDEKTPEFNSEQGKTAADFYVNLAKYSPKDYLNSNSYDGRVAFANGSVGMYVAGAWLAGVLKDEFPKIEGKWATAPLPEGEAGCKTTIAGDNLVMFSAGEKKDATWIWLDFLTRPEGMKRWTVDDPTSTIMPTRTSLLESPELVENKPVLKGFIDAMDCGVTSLINNPKWPKVEETLNEQLGKAIYGEQTGAEAVDAAADEAGPLLARGAR
jgi:multiple sugar transport system substrate-binding protein